MNEHDDEDRLSDVTDLAARAAQRFTDQALAEAKEKNKPQTHPDFDGETCLDCGIDMPPARLEAGRIRCTECQSKEERRSTGKRNI